MRMRKYLSAILTLIILLALVACDAKPLDSEPIQSDNISTSSAGNPSSVSGEGHTGSGNGIPVYSGIYTVGDNLDAGSYTLTCTETSYALKVVVFDSIESYNNYYAAERVTNGEELAAIEKNALVDFYVEEDEIYFLGLNKGQVVMFDSGEGNLEKIDLNKADVKRVDLWFDGNSSPLCTGVYFVGKDIAEAQYKLTCTATDWSMAVTIYASADDYLSYHKSSRFTNGEESDAIQQYSMSNTYINEGDTCFVDLKAGYVLMVKDGTGSLDMVNSDNNISASSNRATLPAYPGVNFVGEYLDPNAYIVTCTETDWSQQIVVFETKEEYLHYHQTSRFTNGEESSAIEQNAISDFYIDQDESCYLNLREGMVLMIDDGVGLADVVSTSWVVK